MQDLIWSYERSHQYFGENLPSSPSFVARYMPRLPSGSSGSGSHQRRPSFAAQARRAARDSTSSHVFDDSESAASASLADEDAALGSGGAVDEGEDEWDQEWDDERLPPNAVAGARPRRRRRSTPVAPAPYARPRLPRIDSEAVPAAAATESTPLLSSSPPADTVPFARPSSYAGGGTPVKPIAELDEPASSGSTLTIGYERHPSASSTAVQTLFNSINVLVGVSILAEPLAFAQAGWVFSFLILLFCGLITNWTCVVSRVRGIAADAPCSAKLLARMLAQNRSLMTYSDVAASAFGPGARVFISCLFVAELTGLRCARSLASLVDATDAAAAWRSSSSSATRVPVCSVRVRPSLSSSPLLSSRRRSSCHCACCPSPR